MTMDLIVRDLRDYPSAADARASLPPMYMQHPYVGVWLQDGDQPEYPMYVFTTRAAGDLLAARWTLIEPA